MRARSARSGSGGWRATSTTAATRSRAPGTRWPAGGGSRRWSSAASSRTTSRRAPPSRWAGTWRVGTASSGGSTRLRCPTSCSLMSTKEKGWCGTCGGMTETLVGFQTEAVAHCPHDHCPRNRLPDINQKKKGVCRTDFLCCASAVVFIGVCMQKYAKV
ncbi:hypothetical protein VTK73DRAFT_4932 [Phialemonium thermophilum]|uniref:Uncharacterized protein n=1 Tax=Phialemonium thermophilum TaxID=223376 RepID=A0ABR3V5M8_9PEZI